MPESPAAARGREVRERLLAAAIELIPERGWTAVSTRVLAERAGVTPSVVHYHFPSVTAVLNEAVVGFMRQALGEVEGVLESAATPVEAVDAMFASVDRYTGADPASLIFVEAYLAATRDEHLRDQVAQILGEFRGRFESWLADHGVPAPEATAAVLAAAVDGVLLHRGLGGDQPSSAEVLRRLVA
ncbi:TetR/AcrR family transcriptional regulator [Kribbella sancticallisti]|uniref:TetR/AcrR family transcriptional regulator n=1 Tax=Kribbella sancticallisti TaxID=460087 RepID=A0ABN2EHK8_9ACTN